MKIVKIVNVSVCVMGRADFKTDTEWYDSDDYKDSLERCCEGMDWFFRYEFDDIAYEFILFINNQTGDIDMKRPANIIVKNERKLEVLTLNRWRK